MREAAPDFDDDLRAARDIFGHMGGERPRIEIVTAAGAGADQKGDGFAGVESLDALGERRRRAERESGADNRGLNGHGAQVRLSRDEQPLV